MEVLIHPNCCFIGSLQSFDQSRVAISNKQYNNGYTVSNDVTIVNLGLYRYFNCWPHPNCGSFTDTDYYL